MAYINIETKQYPISEQEIRAQFPETTFPAVFVTPDAYAWVFPSPAPSFDALTQTVREIAPVVTAKGNYEQRWEIVDLPADQVAANRATADATLIGSIVSSTQSRIDAFASTRGYDGVNSVSKYQNISDAEIAALPASEQALVSKFRAEARYLAVATAQTWAKLYGMLGEVKAGVRPKPTGFSEVESDLPALEWPV